MYVFWDDLSSPKGQRLCYLFAHTMDAPSGENDTEFTQPECQPKRAVLPKITLKRWGELEIGVEGAWEWETERW